MRRIAPRPAALLIALLLMSVVPAVATASTPASSPSGASTAPTGPPVLGPGLVDAAAALGAGETLEVIVTAHEAAGLDELDRLGVPHRRLRTVPIAFATLTSAQLSQLAGSTTIRSLWPRESYDVFLAESTQMVGADMTEQVLGIDGDGVAVAVIDTGIDATHPDLPWQEKVLANYEVAANPFDPSSALLVDLPDTDDDGHGTHVASTVAGRDDDGGNLHDGVAPGASLYGYSVNVSLTIDNARSLAAFDDIVAKRRAGEPIVAISNSWGGGPGEYNPDDPLSVITKAAYDEGISVVFAAGNSGQEAAELDTASRQCTMPWVICVGAQTKPGQLVAFSGRGRPPVPVTVTQPDGTTYEVPAGNHDRTVGQQLDVGVFRPTVSGPGVNIVAACARAACGTGGDYQSLSGTSMSTPHISGVVALANAARGSLDLGAGEVIDLLERTADPMPGWELWEAGAGAVDAYEAARVAAGDAPLPPSNFGATSRPLGAGTEQQQEGVATPAGYSTFPAGGTEHEVEVAPGTGRLDLLVEWDNPVENLYVYAWQPSADPDGDDATRADQEVWGLLEGLGPRINTFRSGSVTYPEPGTWRVRVYGRVNTVTPYTLTTTARSAEQPSVTVTDARSSGDGVTLRGTAGYPAPSPEGVTRAAVAGTALASATAGEPVEMFLHGSAGELDKWVTPEPTFDTEPPSGVPQTQAGTWLMEPGYARDETGAFWTGKAEGVIQGDVEVKVWVSSPTQVVGGILQFSLAEVPEGGAGYDNVRVIASTEVSAASVTPAPTEITAVMPNVSAALTPGHDLVLQVGGRYVDVDYFTVWYDAAEVPSSLTLPLLATGGEAPDAVQGLTATSLTGGGARLAWAPAEDASSYEVYRSADPAALGTRITSGPATSFLDAGLGARQVAYYRVVALSGAGAAGQPSDLAVAQPVDPTGWVEARAGSGPWQTIARNGNSHTWSAALARAAGPGADPAAFTVRSVTPQGRSNELRLEVPAT